ncbi:MAG: addiction module toxin, HicA family [Gemmatimonadetes bacterium]|nr:addiction module toxin, HicA family [Gemmatimonadota bacterium]MYJ10965.1 addiction module toxin, HicA family [Gemmatimonadota bacterium]
MSSVRDRVVWDQLKSLTAKDLVRALNRDGWEEEDRRGATRGFKKDDKRLVIHYHPKRTYRPKLLKDSSIGQAGTNMIFGG